MREPWALPQWPRGPFSIFSFRHAAEVIDAQVFAGHPDATLGRRP
ncbi:hypothetical protein [Terrabacter sp. 2YAF2]